MTSKVIIYTYFKSDSSDFNLLFFIKNQLKIYDIDCILVINGYDTSDDISTELKDVKNVTIIKRENEGFDFGGHTVALEYLSYIGKRYNYYFFMNSGVVGPVLPPYLKTYDWTNIFINKINNKTKLVGTTIVCLPDYDDGGYGPKVEGFFFMTDSIGLELLKKDGKIFINHPSKYSAIINGEYGLSNCILRNGYTIDCMLRRYQGIDWSDKKNWTLNNNKHPSRHLSLYGYSIDPYEVIFHKWYWLNEPLVEFNIIKKINEENKIK
jgi:hypothetical protein